MLEIHEYEVEIIPESDFLQFDLENAINQVYPIYFPVLEYLSHVYLRQAVVPDKKVHGDVEQSVRSGGHHHLAVAGVEAHQSAGLLVRAVSALNLAVTPLLHADTGAVLAGELVVIAGGHGHVPAVLRPTGVVVDLPGLGAEQERSCRGRANSLEMFVDLALSSPLGGRRVKPRHVSVMIKGRGRLTILL